MKITGAQALIKSLEMEGVEVVFGLPGGCILPAYDPLLSRTISAVSRRGGATHPAVAPFVAALPRSALHER